MSLKYMFAVLVTFACCLSCKDTNSVESPKMTQSQLDSIRLAEEKATADTKIFAWVNNLRVREEPDTKSKIVIELQEGDSVIYLKEQTDFTQKITLRGKSFDEPWLKIKTQNNKVGWVYGGGVKFYAPKAVRKPMLYDKCFEYLKEYRQVKFQACFEEEQAKQFRRTRGIVNSSEKGLNLRLLTGKKISLENDTSAHRPVRYRFFYYYPKMSSFVVEATYEDGTDFIIIDDKTGKRTTVWGYPKPSPDNEKWVTSFVGDKAGKGTKGGMQILAYINGGLEIIWEEGMKTEPHVPYWLDEETIEVTTKRKGSSKTTVKTLIKKGKDWIWKK
ncbi:MAG: SH3 domain-containing protein [Saprospiraceae bacterium]